MSLGSRSVDQSLADFTRELAELPPEVAGAGAAAQLVATGAALVCAGLRRHAIGEAGVWAAGRVEELEVLRARALELVDLGREAGRALASVVESPEGSGEGPDLDKTGRKALANLSETMETGVSVLRLAAVAVAECADGEADVGLEVGASFVASGLEGASVYLGARAAAIEDREFAAEEVLVGDAMRAEATALLAEVRAES